MTPTYEIENFQFYRADNMEIMKQYPDKYFDLAIVDPPYGIGLVRTKNGNRGIRSKKVENDTLGWDSESPPVEYFNELFRISKNQIIFGANNFISKMPINTTCWIVWDCINGDNYFADFQMAWTSFTTACRFIRVSQRFTKNEDIVKRIHDTQKPVELYSKIIEKYAEPGFKILDTNLGSGSITIAIDKANQLDKKNLSFVGIELDEDYFNAGIERFKNYKRQLNLF